MRVWATYSLGSVVKVAILTFILVLLLALGAGAQADRATVRLDGRAVFRVGYTEELDATARSRQIERRLNRLLENPTAIAPAQTETTQDSNQQIITVAGVPVVTITESDAQDNVTTVDALSQQWSQAIDAALQRASQQRLSPWGRFVSEVRSSIATAFGRLLESAIVIIPRALAALLVIGLFWAIATGMRWSMRLLFRRIIADLTIENLIKQVAYYAVWTLGVIVALDAFGFDPQTVATGLGLTSLALGFALKDILSNFVSGILILLLRPFELNDQIIVGETEGNVERIDLRATQLKTYDGRVVLVPNAELFTSRIINNTAAPVRRSRVSLPIGYDSDLAQVVQITNQAAQATAGVLAEPPTSVRIQELGPDDILLEVRFWTDSRRSDVVLTSSSVRTEVVRALKAAGIGLPDPSLRTLTSRQPDNLGARTK